MVYIATKKLAFNDFFIASCAKNNWNLTIWICTNIFIGVKGIGAPDDHKKLCV